LKLAVSWFENILAVIGLNKDQSVLNNANSGALYSIFCCWYIHGLLVKLNYKELVSEYLLILLYSQLIKS